MRRERTKKLILFYFDEISQPVIGPFGSSGGCHVSLTVVGSDCSISAVNSAGLEDGAAIIIFVSQNQCGYRI